jgi:hypothetical protein
VHTKVAVQIIMFGLTRLGLPRVDYMNTRIRPQCTIRQMHEVVKKDVESLLQPRDRSADVPMMTELLQMAATIA